VRVKFGPPLHVEDMKPAQIVATVETALRGLITDLRKLRQEEQDMDLPRM
jgi:hypothetical protein